MNQSVENSDVVFAKEASVKVLIIYKKWTMIYEALNPLFSEHGSFF